MHIAQGNYSCIYKSDYNLRLTAPGLVQYARFFIGEKIMRLTRLLYFAFLFLYII